MKKESKRNTTAKNMLKIMLENLAWGVIYCPKSPQVYGQNRPELSGQTYGFYIICSCLNISISVNLGCRRDGGFAVLAISRLWGFSDTYYANYNIYAEKHLTEAPVLLEQLQGNNMRLEAETIMSN